jgi:hypothetical protein
MFCRFCGTTLPTDSTFCQSCGKSLTATTQTSTSGAAAATAPAPAPIVAPGPEQRGTKTGMRVGILLGVLLTFFVVFWIVKQFDSNGHPTVQQIRPTVPVPQPRVMNLVDTAFTLNAAQGMHWNFTVPANATDVRVEGTFNASGGTGNDVEVYLLNDDEFVNWQNRHAVSALYNSGRMTQGTLDAVLPPGAGTYHLVFSNKFSLFSPKAVRASIRLRYTF